MYVRQQNLKINTYLKAKILVVPEESDESEWNSFGK
jgi:hypothetical protein